MASPEVFSVHEAQAAIYLADAADEATGDALYVGECMNGVTVRTSYEQLKVAQHGRTRRKNHNVDEEHEIAWERWYTVKDVDGELILPDLDGMARYVLVLVWYSQEFRYWMKRIYTGVVVKEAPLGHDTGMTHNHVLLAEKVETVKGLASAPDLTAVLIGTLLFLTGLVETVAYTYDFDTATWTSTGLVDTADVEVDDSGDFALSVAGTPALWVDGDEVRCAEIRAVGDLTLSDTGVDRVEFWRGGTHYFTVTAATGLLTCRNLVERGTRPTGGDDLVMRDAGANWRGSMIPGGLRAQELREG